MRGKKAVCWGVLVGMTLPGCAGRAAENPDPQVAIGRMETVTVVRGDQSLREFRPVRDAVTSGGVCTRFALPRPGVRRLSVTFPSLEAPETAVSLIVDSSNVVLRYNETRGLLPRSARRTSPVAAPRDTVAQTTVQLDYVTGEAILSNRGPGQDARPVMTSVAAVEKTGVVGDIASRQLAAMRVCTRKTP